MYNTSICPSRSESRHTHTYSSARLHHGTILTLLERAVRDEADPQIIERLQWMLHFAEHGSVSGTCEHFSISRSSFYRWLKRFDPQNLSSLIDHPTRPNELKNSRVPEFPTPYSYS
ncbi:MAG: helix-turn-helix domain-containing protein [Candidatus Peribacteraceae bacterium]|nr:helix-turn-helix domain-containing protein [Candidatus Peribacteraceae bacterium]